MSSRYAIARAFSSEDATYYGTRTPLKYRDDPSNIVHVVSAGDTLHTLASAYFSGFESPAQLWWAIAEFQPTPIVDPTQYLEPGAAIIIPPASIVVEAFSNERPAELV